MSNSRTVLLAGRDEKRSLGAPQLGESAGYEAPQILSFSLGSVIRGGMGSVADDAFAAKSRDLGRRHG